MPYITPRVPVRLFPEVQTSWLFPFLQSHLVSLSSSHWSFQLILNYFQLLELSQLSFFKLPGLALCLQLLSPTLCSCLPFFLILLALVVTCSERSHPKPSTLNCVFVATNFFSIHTYHRVAYILHIWLFNMLVGLLGAFLYPSSGL